MMDFLNKKTLTVKGNTSYPICDSGRDKGAAAFDLMAGNSKYCSKTRKSLKHPVFSKDFN
jgi:hypothetical protein